MKLFNLEIANYKKVEFDKTTISYNSGYRLIVGDPESKKTTFSLWSMRQLLKSGKLSTFTYCDFDSKDEETMARLALVAKQEGWQYISGYHPTILEQFKGNNFKVLEYCLDNAEYGSGLIIDTLNKVTNEENNNDKASAISSKIKSTMVAKGLLIDCIGHLAKDKTKGLRGASAVMGDIGYALKFIKENKTTSTIFVTKDSRGRNQVETQKMVVNYLNTDGIITDTTLELTEINDKDDTILDPKQLREIEVARYRHNVLVWTASYLAQMQDDTIGLTDLKKIVLKCINKSSATTKKEVINPEFTPVHIIRDEFRNIVDTELETSVEKRGKHNVVLVHKVVAKTFIAEHPSVSKMMEVYV